MKPYESYKELSTFCLIPSSWQVLRLGNIFSENNNTNIDGAETNALQFKFGEIIRKKRFDIDEELKKTLSKYTLVEQNNIMINGLNLNYDFLTQRVGLVKERGVITSAYISLTPISETNTDYYNYLLKSFDSQKVFNGMGSGIRLTLDYNELKKMLLPVPPREEQDQIVRYLDWQLSKINKLIKAKKKQIELLNALKKGVINSAVTHGLNKNVKFKHSGVEWLGQIPEHWETIKLRQLLSPISIKNQPELPLLSVVREQGVIVRDIEDKESNHNFIPDDLSGYKVVKQGQLAMNKMKAWQGSYGVSNYTGIVSPAYYIFDINFENLEYFHYAIRSKVYVNFFAQASDGIRVGQWDLSLQKMKEIPFIVPPKDEQKEIINYIPKAIKQYEYAISILDAELDLLTEYKISLISSVVTGKVDVRGIEIPDFEIEDTAEDLDELEETEDLDELEE